MQIESTAQDAPSKSDDRKLILEMYFELARNERHFSDLEAKYRVLASGWALATLAAIGYVQISHGDTFFDLDKSAVEAIIGLLGAFGVTLIWGLDVRVYHQLLDSNFVECLELERKHKWLPKGRYKTFSQYIDWVEDYDKPAILKQIKRFYQGTIGIGLVIATLFAIKFIYSNAHQSRYFSTVLATFGGIAIGALGYFWLNLVTTHSTSIPITKWIEEQKSRRREELETRGGLSTDL